MFEYIGLSILIIYSFLAILINKRGFVNLRREFKKVRTDLDEHKARHNSTDKIYTKLSEVYELELNSNPGLNLKDTDLIAFLYFKFTKVLKFVNYAVYINTLAVETGNENFTGVKEKAKNTRDAVVEYCAAKLGEEFAYINSESNAEIYNSALVDFLIILKDKVRNSKNNRLLEAGKRLLMRTMRATIAAYAEYNSKLIETEIGKIGEKDVYNLIENNKLYEAAVLLKNLGADAAIVSNLLGQITDIIKAEILGSETNENITKMKSRMRKSLTELHSTLKD